MGSTTQVTVESEGKQVGSVGRQSDGRQPTQLVGIFHYIVPAILLSPLLLPFLTHIHSASYKVRVPPRNTSVATIARQNIVKHSTSDTYGHFSLKAIFYT